MTLIILILILISRDARFRFAPALVFPSSWLMMPSCSIPRRRPTKPRVSEASRPSATWRWRGSPFGACAVRARNERFGTRTVGERLGRAEGWAVPNESWNTPFYTAEHGTGLGMDGSRLEDDLPRKKPRGFLAGSM